MRSSAALFLLLAAGCRPPSPLPVKEAQEDLTALRAAPLRMLTRFEFDNTVRDVLGDVTRPGQALPAEPVAFGLDNNGDVVSAGADVVDRLLDVAEGIAARTLRDARGRILPCAAADGACATFFIDTTGRRLFRRPLSAEEKVLFARLFQQTQDLEGFDRGIESTLTAMLLSPQFLYRAETAAKAAAAEPLTAFELASRLSYFLWASSPDDALLARAEAGDLVDPDMLGAEATRLLNDPRSTVMPTHFFHQWLGLSTIATLGKDKVVYPQFREALPLSWARSLSLFLEDRLTSLPDMLTDDSLFVNDAMGDYGPQGMSHPTQFVRVRIPGVRVGLLTQPGLLARLASPDQSSPVRRGVFVYDKLLCQPLPAPPPGVSTVPPAAESGSTTRERFAIHGKTAGCNACHQQIDGVGFGFENYDGVGAFRTTENGKPVDASGHVTLAREEALKGPFNGAAELMNRLARSRQVHDCLATQFYRAALGRVETPGDSASVASAQSAFFASGGDFGSLRMAVVRSKAFSMKGLASVAP